jgi:hypothetical protein
VSKKYSDSPSSSSGHLDEIGKKLGMAVNRQWSENVKRITEPYPLEVPFSVVMTAMVDLSKEDPEIDGNGAAPEGVRPQGPPRIEQVTVMDSWAAILKKGARPVVLDGTFIDIVSVFTSGDLPRRMVILGDPGSGKSMIAQWLTVQLLEDHSELELVPVFLSLAMWNPDERLEEWAAVEMAQTYQFLGEAVRASDGQEQTLAYQLIDEKRILMVLDGLDEMARPKQTKALQKLSEFATSGQHFVVTCRTEDYARIVHYAGKPLAKTPVIALGPLDMDGVIQYLKDTYQVDSPSGLRWSGLLEHLMTEPDGPLAIAMTSALVVWLVCTNYSRPQTSPDELLDMGSAEDITEFLLDGLVDAVYSVEVNRKSRGKYRETYPAIEGEGLKLQEDRLVFFADYLSRRLQKVDGKPASANRLDIEWWYLPRAIPKWFVGGTVGVVCGCLLGACGGVAAAIKFGHTVGVIVGIALAIAAGLHAGTTSIRWQDEPRSVGFNHDWTTYRVLSCLAAAIGIGFCFGYAADRGGGMTAALVTAALAGPLCAMAIWPTFGKMPAAATAVTASLAFGLGASLFGHRPGPLVSGVAAGLTILVCAWVFTGVFQVARRERAVSPESLLRGDRDGSIIVALTAGLAFAVIFGLALGPLVGLLAFAGLTVTAAFTVSMWGAFTVTRIWLALFRRMPLDIMGFLREADTRGVLRRSGGAFQFRHVRVQEWLSSHATQARSHTVSRSRSAA